MMIIMIQLPFRIFYVLEWIGPVSQVIVFFRFLSLFSVQSFNLRKNTTNKNVSVHSEET